MMRKVFAAYLIMIFLCFKSCSDKTEISKPEMYKANWESLNKHNTPSWFSDAKFGIFIHWGPYCVPEYGSEWYPRLMYMDKYVVSSNNKIISESPSDVYTYHVKNWGSLDKFGYKDFIPMFTGERFDANEWMQLFKNAGAKYVVSVAEHHDGFAMYNSSQTRWNSMKMGPKRDVLGELASASGEYGLKFGASSHFAFNWNYYEHKEGFDTMDPAYFDLYGRPHGRLDQPDQEFLDHWWKRTTEIIDKYPLDMLWFDFYWDRSAFNEYHPKLAAYFYNNGLNRNAEVVLQSKNFTYPSFPEGTVVLDIERGKSSTIRKDSWQTDTSIGRNSWGYVKDWGCKSANELIDNLIDIVSKNGCLLLNIGPGKDGTVATDQKDVLLEIGSWLSKNGEAIYGTRPWHVFGEGLTVEESGFMSESNTQYTSEDIRFTVNGNALYALALEWPESGVLTVKSLGNNSNVFNEKIQSIQLLGDNQYLQWEQQENGLVVEMPNYQPSPFAHALKIIID